MGRILIIILMFLLALGSLSGYLILNRLIIEGSLKIAAGEVQIAQGQQKLASGKARLANGEKQLQSGKKVSGQLSDSTMVAAVTVFPLAIAAYAGRHVVNSKLAEGDKEVAAGKQKVQAGEEQLANGKNELQRGIARLNEAKLIRILCGLGAIVFTLLGLSMVHRWRKTLFSRRSK